MPVPKQTALAAWVLVGLLISSAVACVYTPQQDPYVPPPAPEELLGESAAGLRDLRSFKFSLAHQPGSIYYRDNAGSHIKATEITGEWDVETGLALVIDAYLVRSREVEAVSGAYFPLQMVLVPDGLYITDPLSGQWVLQSPELAIISVGSLNQEMAELVSQIANSRLEGVENVDGRETYKVLGRVPASAMDWLPIDPGENAQANITLWIDRTDSLPRKVHFLGAIGQYDDPGTMRQLTLWHFNQSVRINPPGEFIDLR